MKKVREIFISIVVSHFIVSALYSCNAISFADAAYSSDLDYVEEHSDTPVTYTATPEGQASKARSCKLFAILAGILKNRPLRILPAVPKSNGLEVWRQLHALFVPRTKVRSMAMRDWVMSTERLLVQTYLMIYF